LDADASLGCEFEMRGLGTALQAFGCKRPDQAASISTRRTCGLPAFVIEPRHMCEPLECSHGTIPK
jgi:hypothetical protein